MTPALGYPHQLWSEICPGLWMGGTDDVDTSDVHLPFDAVVTFYAWAKPAPWEVEELRYGFYDGPISQVDLAKVEEAARWAFTRWQSGGKVLIRCQAGLNRSGLVTALTLILSGLSGANAVSTIRGRRGDAALCNLSFAAWILESGTCKLGSAA